MSIVKVIKYFFILSILFIISLLVVLQFHLFSEDLDGGEITGKINTIEFVKDKETRQLNAMEKSLEINKKMFLGGWSVPWLTYRAFCVTPLYQNW